jgi:Ras family protein
VNCVDAKSDDLLTPCSPIRCTRQDEFSILHSDQASGLHGWALVYSVASRSSFEMIHIIRDKILAFNSADTVPMVLIGNKSDLADRDR